jgi:hypothetical protein
MPISQSAAKLSGTYSGTIACTYSGGSNSGAVSGTVNGYVTGDSVYFDLDDSSWRDLGVIQGTGMEGTVNASFLVHGAPITAAGTFICVRQ